MEKKQQNGHFKKVIGLFGGISLVAGMTIGSGAVSYTHLLKNVCPAKEQRLT